VISNGLLLAIAVTVPCSSPVPTAPSPAAWSRRITSAGSSGVAISTSATGALSSDRVYDLSRGRGGNIWIGTEAGLDRWNAAAGSLERFGATLNDRAVASVLEDRSGAVWAGTFDAGLVRFAADGHVLETFRHDAGKPTSLASNEVRAILEDKDFLNQLFPEK